MLLQTLTLRCTQVLALLERVKLEDAGLVEPPPIGLPGYVPAAATAAQRGYGPEGSRDQRPDWRAVLAGTSEGAGATLVVGSVSLVGFWSCSAGA